VEQRVAQTTEVVLVARSTKEVQVVQVTGAESSSNLAHTAVVTADRGLEEYFPSYELHHVEHQLKELNPES